MTINKNNKTKETLILSIIFCLIIVFQAIGQQQSGQEGIFIAKKPGEGIYKDDPVMPAGIKGERIKAFIVAVNSDNPAHIREFIENHCTGEFQNNRPVDQHISMFQRLYQNTGGIDFLSIRKSIPERKYETAIIVKGRSFGTWRINFFIDEKNDSLIGGMYFSSTIPVSAAKDSLLSETQFLQNIKEFMEGLIEKDIFSGTLLIAKGDELLMTLAGGEASKRFHVPNTIDTKFNLGSMNKMFTAISIMQLVEKGKLSLDDPISRYVDETWLPKQITSKITIRHLLSHTSGLGSYFNDTFMRGSRTLFRNLDDFKPLVKEEEPAFEPGTRYLYSNTGMLLLGVVIESVTRESYLDYVRKNIYEPAGMVNSDSYEMDYPVENLAIGYSRDSNSPYGWQNNLYKHAIKGGPAGGGYSTVKDLHRFARAIQTGRLLSKKYLDKMWEVQGRANYGYGFEIENGPNGKVVGHSGGFAGINSELKIYLDKGYIVAIMSNYDMGAIPIAREIGQLLSQVR